MVFAAAGRCRTERTLISNSSEQNQRRLRLGASSVKEDPAKNEHLRPTPTHLAMGTMGLEVVVLLSKSSESANQTHCRIPHIIHLQLFMTSNDTSNDSRIWCPPESRVRRARSSNSVEGLKRDQGQPKNGRLKCLQHPAAMEQMIFSSPPHLRKKKF